MPFIPELDFEKLGGILPAVAQDAQSGEVLMQGFMNRDAFERTVSERVAYYYSRSKKRLWMKGEQSGHRQRVVEIRVDCDDDSVLLKVIQEGGAACHTGYRSCYHRRLDADGLHVEGEPLFDPRSVYGAGSTEEDERA